MVKGEMCFYLAKTKNPNLCLVIRKTPRDETTFVFIREETGFVIKKRKFFVIITKDLVTARKPGDSSLSSRTQYTPGVQGFFLFVFVFFFILKPSQSTKMMAD